MEKQAKELELRMVLNCQTGYKVQLVSRLLV